MVAWISCMLTWIYEWWIYHILTYSSIYRHNYVVNCNLGPAFGSNTHAKTDGRMHVHVIILHVETTNQVVCQHDHKHVDIVKHACKGKNMPTCMLPIFKKRLIYLLTLVSDIRHANKIL